MQVPNDAIVRAYFLNTYFTSAATPSTSTAIMSTMMTTPANPLRLMPKIFMPGPFARGRPDYTTRGHVLSEGPRREARVSKREKTGRRYRKLVAHRRSLGLPCWICGKAIRYDLPGGHPLSYEYDHYYPASRWKEFGYPSQAACIHDPENGRSAHRICNERRQGAMPWEKGWQRLGAARKSPPAPPKKGSRAE